MDPVRRILRIANGVCSSLSDLISVPSRYPRSPALVPQRRCTLELLRMGRRVAFVGLVAATMLAVNARVLASGPGIGWF